MHRFPVALLALLIAAATAASAQAAPPAYDIRGAWQGVAAASAFSGTVTFDTANCTTGAFSGSAASGGKTFPAGGQIDGTAVSLTIGPFSTEPGDIASGSATFVDANRIKGTFRDNDTFKDAPGDFQLVRQSGPPNDGQCLLKRPSVVRVSCDYAVATSIDTCTATVGDATAAPTTPTGTVTFTAAGGGVFSPGDSCALESGPVAPATASCAVQYRAPSGPRTYPEITATYSGDASHAENRGTTRYLALGGPLPYEITTPGMLEVQTTVPADGTKVEACALVSAPATAGASDTTSRQRAPRKDLAQVLKEINILGGRLKLTTPAGSVKTTRDLEAMLGRAAEAFDLAREEAGRLRASPNPSDQQQLVELQQQMSRLLEAVSNIQRMYHDACVVPIRNLRAVAAARSRAARIGYAPRRTAKRGALVLKLRLSTTALRRAAGKRRRVTVYIRVNEVLPSQVLARGWPRATVQKVVLTRDGRRAR